MWKPTLFPGAGVEGAGEVEAPCPADVIGQEIEAISLLVPPSVYLERCVETVQVVEHDTAHRTMTMQVRLGPALDLLCRREQHERIELDASFSIEPTFRAQVPPFRRPTVDAQHLDPGGAGRRTSIWVPTFVIPRRKLVNSMDLECDPGVSWLPSEEVSGALTQAAAARALRLWCTEGSPTAPLGTGNVDQALVDMLARVAIGAVSRSTTVERHFDYQLLEKNITALYEGHFEASDHSGQRRRALDRLLRWIRIATAHSVLWLPVEPIDGARLQLRYAVRLHTPSTPVRLVRHLRGHRQGNVGLTYAPANCWYEGQPPEEREALDAPENTPPFQVTLWRRSLSACDAFREIRNAIARQLGFYYAKEQLAMAPWLARTQHVQVLPVPGTLLCGLFMGWYPKPGGSLDQEQPISDHQTRIELHSGGGHLYLRDKPTAANRRLTDPLGARGSNRRPSVVTGVSWPGYSGAGAQAIIGALVAYVFVFALALFERERHVFTQSGEDATIVVALLVGAGSAVLATFARLPAHSRAIHSFGLQRIVVGAAGTSGFLLALTLTAASTTGGAWVTALFDVLWIGSYIATVMLAMGYVVTLSVKFWLAYAEQSRLPFSRARSVFPGYISLLMGFGALSLLAYAASWAICACSLPVEITDNAQHAWRAALLILGGIAFAASTPVVSTALWYLTSTPGKPDPKRRLIERLTGTTALLAVLAHVGALAHIAAMVW